MSTEFGSLLKRWRTARRLSQLDLALEANISARHLSFLETGRAQPSRAMATALAETLGAPRAERNVFLQAAGYAPAYRARDLGDAEMSAAREALAWTLSRHAPYPAFALDRIWTLVDANAPARPLLAVMGLDVGGSLLDAFVRGPALRGLIENWDEVARGALMRLKTESAHYGGDPVLDAAIRELESALGGPTPAPTGGFPALVSARYRLGETTFSVFSLIAQFGSTEDIALADLKIELLFPADAATKAAFEAAGSA